MRKVRLKYQHVIAIFPLLTASLNTKKTHAHTLYKHVYIAYKYSQSLDTSAFSLLTVSREKGGRDMLIFQPHLPHIITNSRRPLHDLSHSKIILRKARFPYQHVTLKHWPPTQMIKLYRMLWPVIKLLKNSFTGPVSCLHYLIYCQTRHSCLCCSCCSGRVCLKL